MINNHLIIDAMAMQQVKARYDEAEKNNNTEGMEAARKSYQALSQRIENRGAGYAKGYRLYEEAVERGNEHIDLNEVIWDKDVESLIQLLRENGVEYFTFSSTWSSAVEIAWLFTQNGCTLEGLVEVNSPYTNTFTGEREKAHGYLFAIH